jgi:hypothetical protein
MGSKIDHPLNMEGELYKYRKIIEKKTFSLEELPDAYRLLPSQGRANIFRIVGMADHVRRLAENDDEKKVLESLRRLSFDGLMDLLGAAGWESFAFAYLILEHKFVPTGLSVGRTLPTLDIIGRRRTDGVRIVAQCKKHNHKEPIDQRFCEAVGSGDVAFYFAYGGCVGDVPENVQIVDKRIALVTCH